MNLRDVILDSSVLDDDLVLYARRVDGEFQPVSEAVLLQLTEEEQEMKTHEVANRKCPGFSYCIEVFLLKEVMQDFDATAEMQDIEEKVDRIIYFINYDA